MAKLADIVFTLDTTGSMGFAIEAMKRTITQLADIYLEARIDTRLGVIQFRDRVNFGETDSGNPTLRRELFDGSEFTSDARQFRERVEWFRATGGGPEPESSFDALALAGRSDWRDEANRIIIHITDATPHQPDREIGSVGELVGMLSDSMIDQLHFIVPDFAMDAFEQLAETKNDGRDGTHFATVTWTNITADTEDIIEKLRKIAKTSSGSIVDKGELIFREDEEADVILENPFEVDDAEDVDEIDVVEEMDDEIGDYSVNPFDDLD